MDNDVKVETCKFSYSVCRLIILEDNNMGGRSLTNAMEAALQHVAGLENIKNMEDYIILYKDSDGECSRVAFDPARNAASFNPSPDIGLPASLLRQML
jgi:hypothetical protein